MYAGVSLNAITLRKSSWRVSLLSSLLSLHPLIATLSPQGERWASAFWSSLLNRAQTNTSTHTQTQTQRENNQNSQTKTTNNHKQCPDWYWRHKDGLFIFHISHIKKKICLWSSSSVTEKSFLWGWVLESWVARGLRWGMRVSLVLGVGLGQFGPGALASQVPDAQVQGKISCCLNPSPWAYWLRMLRDGMEWNETEAAQAVFLTFLIPGQCQPGM